MENFKGLAHIALFTKDLEGSITFYEKLGAKVIARGEAQKPGGVNLIAMMALADFQLEIVQPWNSSTLGRDAGPWAHLAIEVSDLEGTMKTLKTCGIHTFMSEQPVELPNLFGGMKNIYFTGPNGEQIELMEKY